MWLTNFRGVCTLLLIVSVWTMADRTEAQPPDAAEQSTAASEPGPSLVSESPANRTEESTLDEASISTPSSETNPERNVSGRDVIASLTIFVLAVFVGFEVITKVPPTLHTPLMSGSNAISGITIVGALIVASSSLGGVSNFIGFLAVALATINVVGGFWVTHRMLAMFKK